MRFGTFDRIIRFGLWLGIVLFVIGFAVHYWSIQAVQNIGGMQADPNLFSPTWIVRDLRFEDGPTNAFGTALLSSGARLMYKTLSTVGLVIFLIGLAAMVVGLVGARRHAVVNLAQRFAAIATSPRFGAVFVSIFVLFYIVITVRLVRLILVNFLTFSLAWGFVFLLSLGSLVWVETYAGKYTTVLIVGPLSVSSVFLSTIAGAFVSPATGQLMVELTNTMVSVILKIVLPKGLSRWLTRVLELDGAGLLGFWMSVTTVVGVGIGVIMVTTESFSIRELLQSLQEAMIDSQNTYSGVQHSD